MPRENRKRGKKQKKQKPEEEGYDDDDQVQGQQLDEPRPEAGPSWIRQGTSTREDPDSEFNPEAPFGFVDPDVKAYFKTVDDKLKEWQDFKVDNFGDEEEGEDVNNERKLFLVAALDEMSGNEKQLATDPDCSNVLERMMFSMDDFVKRVFADRLAGSYMALSKHRFGSHVVQTLLSSAKTTVQREAKGILPTTSSKEEISSSGSLPTMTDLILSISNELIQNLPTLMIDPFASHVLRALFVLLCPFLHDEDSSKPSILRSKKSAKHRAKQGPLKSVFNESSDGNPHSEKAIVPESLSEMARRIVQTVKETMDGNEVRALAANAVGCPVLLLLLEMEAVQDSLNKADSLLDSVSHGLLSASLSGEDGSVEPSDYVITLLREPVASHLLEKLVSLCPQTAFPCLWRVYFQGKLGKLASHPVANFPVARGMERLDEAQFKEALSEMEGTWSKLLKNSRMGVLRACVERAGSLGRFGDSVGQIVREVFSMKDDKNDNRLIPCALHMKTWEEYQALVGKTTGDPGQNHPARNDRDCEPTVQGSTLLQSILRLPDPHNSMVIDGLTSMPVPELIHLSRNAISSRVLDEFLESKTVPTRAKRKFLLSLIGHYHELADDRIGSRVADRCWASADPYLKEKIARSLMNQERFLLSSQYGRFFGRKLQLHLLKKDPERWKEAQAQSISGQKDAVKLQETQCDAAAPVAGPQSKTDSKEKKKKRKRGVNDEDEIDAVFAVLEKKSKTGTLKVKA